MERFLKISQQTLWQVLGKIITSVSTFIFLGIVARNYGEAGTGVFTLVLTYLAVFYLLGDFGFNAHLLKTFQYLSQEEKTQLFKKLLGLRLYWSLILAGISLALLLILPFATPVFSIGVLVGCLAIIASSVFVTNNLVFQSKLRYDLSVLASSVGTLIGLGILLFLVRAGSSLGLVVMPHVLGWTIIAAVSLLLVKKFVGDITPQFDKGFSFSLVRDSWPIAVTLALNVVYFRADAFILSTLKSNTEVGVYNLAYSVFQSALVLPTFIMNAYYPVMLKTLKVQPEKFFGQLKVSAGMLLFIAAIGTIFTYIAAPLVISLLTGTGFSGSVDVLRILALGFPGYFLSALFMWLLVVKERYKTLMIIYGAGLIFNLAANLMFIPGYSYIASAWITVGSEYLILGLQLILLKFTRK